MRFTYEQYHAFSAPLEGRVHTMYCDCLGLITTGVGNLINTLSGAKALPWKLADGAPADMADVAADWNKLHDGAQYYAKRAWMVYAKTMLCRLEDAAIDELCLRQLAANEAIMKKRFPDFDAFPADAQLALHSMAWAVGAGFASKFPHLSDCIDRRDWEGCVACCKIREEGNPGVVPRNAKNRFCFHNAALVKAHGLDAGVLHWPEVVAGAPLTQAMVPAVDAWREAETAQAAWSTHPMYRYESPQGGAALQEYEAS